MFDASRRAFLESALGTAGVAVLGAHRLLQAQELRTGEPAMSGDDQPELASFDALMVGFTKEHQVPGAALAVARGSRLVYARGFGMADLDQRQPVQPASLFRIASISKPVTAVAILQLVERRQLDLHTTPWEVLGLPEPSDVRWKRVTVLHLLQHTGGWDSEKSFDPMFRPVSIAKALKVMPPAQPSQVVRFMLGQPLDFDPGSRHAYSNFGYCLLGRVVERVSRVTYQEYVQREVLNPLGIRGMRLGKTAPAQRAPNEVVYYGERSRGGGVAAKGPSPLGSWSLEAMDSHGGWIASAPDLVRFASAFDVPAKCPILRSESISTMFARPEGPAGYEPGGKARTVYYACGWRGRSVGARINTWHTGSLDGTSTLLVRRHDGLNWAVLFNARNALDGQRLSDRIDGPLHRAADQVRRWPDADQFSRLL